MAGRVMTKTKLYAENTRVPVRDSISEIERILRRYECRNLAQGRSDELGAFLEFSHGSHRFRFHVPPQDDPQEERRLWRVLIIWVKGALEKVASGEPMEVVLFPDLVLPNGQSARALVTQAAEQIGKKEPPSAFAGLLGDGT